MISQFEDLHDEVWAKNDALLICKGERFIYLKKWPCYFYVK